jgi:phage tail sheath protein FI
VSTVTTTIANSYNTTANYGASYYPYIYVPDPSSRVGGTKKIAPGGAVTAMYVKADAQKGPFQSPAGVGTKIANAVSVASLTNADFNTISNNSVALNVIRFIPGTGICVMGARTLSKTANDQYVSVRRSLIYLNKSLSNLTQFAVFEPNDDVLWGRVRTLVDSFLYGFWRTGGLKGANSSQAYYVICDGSINTQAAIDAGELRIEVGVALQKPAEFIIIKIGQMDGGTTVTVQG